MVGIADAQDQAQAEGIGRLVADYAVLRQMSLGVAGMLTRGEDAGLAAALVKDQGALLEQRLPEVAHALFADAALSPESREHACKADCGHHDLVPQCRSSRSWAKLMSSGRALRYQ